MTVIKVTFTCPVLRAATAFSGRALPDAADGLPQELSGGNAAAIASASGGKVVRNAANIVVQVPIKGALLINAGATPKVFTPNGDGFNETTVLDYDVTSLIGSADVKTRIYDLSGRLVREVYHRHRQKRQICAELGRNRCLRKGSAARLLPVQDIRGRRLRERRNEWYSSRGVLTSAASGKKGEFLHDRDFHEGGTRAC